MGVYIYIYGSLKANGVALGVVHANLRSVFSPYPLTPFIYAFYAVYVVSQQPIGANSWIGANCLLRVRSWTKRLFLRCGSRRGNWSDERTYLLAAFPKLLFSLDHRPEMQRKNYRQSSVQSHV